MRKRRKNKKIERRERKRGKEREGLISK